MFKISDILLGFETKARQVRLVSRIEAKFRIFDPARKIYGRGGHNSEFYQFGLTRAQLLL